MRAAAEEELAARGGVATQGLVQLYFPGLERGPSAPSPVPLRA